MADGAEVLNTTLTPVIPADLHGFTVTVGVGPYPPGQPKSHRRAVYAELVPLTDENRRKLARNGRARILGIVPLTAHGAQLIADDPHGQVAEMSARRAVAEASRLARLVNQA